MVAAITMPAVVSNYQKNVTVNSLKKVYSSLSQAASMYQADNGITINEFDTSLPAKEFMNKYITPYMRIIAECDSISDCYTTFPLAIDRSTKITDIDYLSILSDGSYLGVLQSPLSGKVFLFDINGNKGPNYSGRDIFYFYLVNASTMGYNEACAPMMKNLESGLYPGGYGNCYEPSTKYSRDELLGTSFHRGCNRNAKLISAREPFDACAAVIMMDGWKIENDYPW